MTSEIYTLSYKTYGVDVQNFKPQLYIKFVKIIMTKSYLEAPSFLSVIMIKRK